MMTYVICFTGASVNYSHWNSMKTLLVLYVRSGVMLYTPRVRSSSALRHHARWDPQSASGDPCSHLPNPLTGVNLVPTGECQTVIVVTLIENKVPTCPQLLFVFSMNSGSLPGAIGGPLAAPSLIAPLTLQSSTTVFIRSVVKVVCA